MITRHRAGERVNIIRAIVGTKSGDALQAALAQCESEGMGDG